MSKLNIDKTPAKTSIKALPEVFAFEIFSGRASLAAVALVLIISFLLTGTRQPSLAYSYEGHRWITGSIGWPRNRVEINYASLPPEWRKAAYKARMEWNKKGNSNFYFYYSETSRNTVTKGHYGNTEWLAITHVKSLGPYIIEVDTIVNEAQLWCTRERALPWEHDLQSVLAHEFGHWLCLNHSDYTYATMYEKNRRGSIKFRTLSEDDINGIIHIYGIKQSSKQSSK